MIQKELRESRCCFSLWGAQQSAAVAQGVRREGLRTGWILGTGCDCETAGDFGWLEGKHASGLVRVKRPGSSRASGCGESLKPEAWHPAGPCVSTHQPRAGCSLPPATITEDGGKSNGASAFWIILTATTTSAESSLISMSKLLPLVPVPLPVTSPRTCLRPMTRSRLIHFPRLKPAICVRALQSLDGTGVMHTSPICR